MKKKAGLGTHVVLLFIIGPVIIAWAIVTIPIKVIDTVMDHLYEGEKRYWDDWKAEAPHDPE